MRNHGTKTNMAEMSLYSVALQLGVGKPFHKTMADPNAMENAALRRAAFMPTSYLTFATGMPSMIWNWLKFAEICPAVGGILRL